MANNKTPMEIVQSVRDLHRRPASFFINHLFDDFLEMHGDRKFADDPAMMTGIASFEGVPVTVIAQERGDSTKNRVMRNFGSSHPEGYRKALRQMHLAEKFGRPVVSFIDTSGAFCGIEAEERGQGEAIASCLMEMATLKVPTIAIVIGEGGSGGALALAVSDRLWMLENSFYSVISPEGCASILFRNLDRVEEVANYLKFTPKDLLSFGVCHRVFDEEDETQRLDAIRKALKETLHALQQKDTDTLVEERYKMIRKIGVFVDTETQESPVV